MKKFTLVTETDDTYQEEQFSLTAKNIMKVFNEYATDSIDFNDAYRFLVDPDQKGKKDFYIGSKEVFPFGAYESYYLVRGN